MNLLTPVNLSAEGEEFHLLVTPSGSGSFEEQFEETIQKYFYLLKELRSSIEDGIHLTFYVTDAANQEGQIRSSLFYRELMALKISVTILQIPPCYSKVALIAYHIKGCRHFPKTALTLQGLGRHHQGTLISTDTYRYYYLKNMQAEGLPSAKEQTKKIFQGLGDFCRERGMDFNNVIRTWIYIHDIDNNYLGMNEGRNEYFKEINLSPKIGSPASTGIEGRTQDSKTLITMDAILVDGIAPEQSKKMEALSHLCDTRDYKVAFERGRKLLFGDRSHLYLSGTASIDSSGEILHVGHVGKQTERTLENVQILLKGSGSQMEDMTYLVVYLRDFTDAPLVNEILKSQLPPEVPYLLTLGKVCRPGWLIEMEGIAVNPGSHSEYRNFLEPPKNDVMETAYRINAL